jgi:uncharacterized protein
MKILNLIKSHEKFIQTKFHVKKLGLFGSAARDQAKAGSDLDFLVEFEPEYETFDNYMELKFFLEDLFQRPIDLVTPESLRPRMKAMILEEVIYA